jgi:hypothetical protein
MLEQEPQSCEAVCKNGKVCNKTCTVQIGAKKSCKLHSAKDTSKIALKITKKKVSNYSLHDITKKVITNFNRIFDENKQVLGTVDKVLVELQPKVNNKMKLVSHLIYCKLVEFYMETPTKIVFVRAAQKLKAYKGPPITCPLKSSYARRKFLSIEYTRWMLPRMTERAEDWITFFESNKKKDDLADVFLMAINGLQ